MTRLKKERKKEGTRQTADSEGEGCRCNVNFSPCEKSTYQCYMTSKRRRHFFHRRLARIFINIFDFIIPRHKFIPKTDCAIEGKHFLLVHDRQSYKREKTARLVTRRGRGGGVEGYVFEGVKERLAAIHNSPPMIGTFVFGPSRWPVRRSVSNIAP